MKSTIMLKKFKQKIKKNQIYLGCFAVFLLLFTFIAPPNLRPAFSNASPIYLRTLPIRLPSTQIIAQGSQNCGGDDGKTADPRDPGNALIPYIIVPRRTLVLGDKPKLRWNAVPGVKSYTASLQSGDKIIWEKTVSANEIVYPGEPRLRVGTEYLLIVKADNNRSSEEEKLTQRQFKLLPETEAQVVKTVITQLNDQQVADKVKALISAYIYTGSDLKSEAIEALEALVAGGIKEAAVYHKLGNLYWQTGITLLAENKYLKADELATAAKDIPEQAEIAKALGDLYVAIGNQPEAIRWFTQARDNHKTLGNTLQIKELDREIEKLKAKK